MKKVTRDTLKKRWFLAGPAKIGMNVVPVFGSLLLVCWIFFDVARIRPGAQPVFAFQWVMYVAILCGPAGQILGLLANWWWYFRPFKDRVRKHDWRLCPKCAYPFEGSGEVICTECGGKFVGDEVRNAWLGWIKPAGWWKRWRPDT